MTTPRPCCTLSMLASKSIATQLQIAVGAAHGFDQTLLRWRLESATAAVRFIDAIINTPTEQENNQPPKRHAESNRASDRV